MKKLKLRKNNFLAGEFFLKGGSNFFEVFTKLKLRNFFFLEWGFFWGWGKFLERHAKIQNRRQTPSGRKVSGRREKEE